MSKTVPEETQRLIPSAMKRQGIKRIKKESAEGSNDLPLLRLVSLPGGKIIHIHQADVIVGRHPESDLQIIQADVSRRHCRLYHDDRQWYAEDLNSLNGTLVNGERIQRTVLHPNDVIRIGDQLFQVEVAPSAESPGPPSVEDHDRSRSILRSIAAMLLEEEDDLPSAIRRKSA